MESEEDHPTKRDLLVRHFHPHPQHQSEGLNSFGILFFFYLGPVQPKTLKENTIQISLLKKGMKERIIRGSWLI